MGTEPGVTGDTVSEVVARLIERCPKWPADPIMALKIAFIWINPVSNAD